MVVIVAAAITTMPLAACGGSNDEMRVTWTDDGCTYRGGDTAAAGRFTIEVENQTGFGASFALKRLAKGFTADNIEPILAKERAWARSLTLADLRNIKNGKPLVHPHPDLPQIFTDPEHSVVTEIGGGTSSVLPADVPAGSYVLLCRITHLGAEEPYVASQIDVAA